MVGNSHQSHEPTIHCNWGNLNLYLDQPITKVSCQTFGGHVSYPADSLTETRLGLCISLCCCSSIMGNKCCVATPWGCHDRKMLSYEICTFVYLLDMACMDYMDPNALCPQKAVKLDYSMFCVMGQNCRKAVMEWNRACHPGVPHYWPFVKGIHQSPGPVWGHDATIKWKHFPHHWPFVKGIHWWPVDSPHKGQSGTALMFSLICAWTNSWANNRDAWDLRCHHTHYDITVMGIHGSSVDSTTKNQ